MWYFSNKISNCNIVIALFFIFQNVILKEKKITSNTQITHPFSFNIFL